MVKRMRAVHWFRDLRLHEDLPEPRDIADRFKHRPWEAPSPPAAYPPPFVVHTERRMLAVARYQAAHQTRADAPVAQQRRPGTFPPARWTLADDE